MRGVPGRRAGSIWVAVKRKDMNEVMRGAADSGACRTLWVVEEGKRRVMCWKDPGIAWLQQKGKADMSAGVSDCIA